MTTTLTVTPRGARALKAGSGKALQTSAGRALKTRGTAATSLTVTPTT